MSGRAAALALVLACALPGCIRRVTGPITPAHYVVGEPYQSGGAWFYPRDLVAYEATGLAAVAPDHAGLTADGETYDATAMAAGHQTLQLPAVVRVTNLANGRQVLVRLNDRGPASPARLLELTPRAATLLQAVDGTPIRVSLEEAMSRSLAAQVGGGPQIGLVAAPREPVVAEALPPPPGTAQSARGARALGALAATAPASEGEPVPDRLPETVLQGSAEPAQIYLRASEFGRIDYAHRLSARLYGLNPVVETVQDGRGRRYRVRAGPFASVAAADDALEQALRRGVTDAKLVVEKPDF